jgi:hypothetical protein
MVDLAQTKNFDIFHYLHHQRLLVGSDSLVFNLYASDTKYCTLASQHSVMVIKNGLILEQLFLVVAYMMDASE